MINVETCRGCGQPLYIQKVANMVVRLEITPLDAPQATRALLAGRELWRLTRTSLTPAAAPVLAALHGAEPGQRPHVVQEHRCVPAGRSQAVSRTAGSPASPKGPERPVQPLAGQPTPSPAQPTERSSARRADRRHGERSCSVCGKPADVAGYVMIELGATLVDVFHTGTCP